MFKEDPNTGESLFDFLRTILIIICIVIIGIKVMGAIDDNVRIQSDYQERQY